MNPIPSPSPPTPFEAERIIFEDEHYLAAYKPCHLLVHRSNLDFQTRDNLLDRIKSNYRWLAPVHRLDKPASGLVIFAKSEKAFKHLQGCFRDGSVEKKYLVLVRGHVNYPFSSIKPVRDEGGIKRRESKSSFYPLKQFECDWKIGPYITSRYSLLMCELFTGRYHQIRQHLSSSRNPVIGDKRHGDLHHNRFFKESFSNYGVYLHAYSYRFTLPDKNYELKCPFGTHWKKVFSILNQNVTNTFVAPLSFGDGEDFIYF